MKTKCGKPYRVICTDRKHPDGKKIMALVSNGEHEICVCIESLCAVVSSQWFSEPLDFNGGNS